MPSETRAATVLLVEDNPADQNLGRRALQAGLIHCDLHIAADGEEALDYLHRRGPYGNRDESNGSACSGYSRPRPPRSSTN